MQNRIDRCIGRNQTSLVNFLLSMENPPLEIYENAVNYDKEILDEDGEGTYPEVFCWILVDDWTATELESLGEVIMKSPFSGDEWWGRTCFGQAIVLDSTFWRIPNFQDYLQSCRDNNADPIV